MVLDPVASKIILVDVVMCQEFMNSWCITSLLAVYADTADCLPL